jgi:hypothetical protein
LDKVSRFFLLEEREAFLNIKKHDMRSVAVLIIFGVNPSDCTNYSSVKNRDKAKEPCHNTDTVHPDTTGRKWYIKAT